MPRSPRRGAVLVDDERELVDAVGALSVTRSRPHPDPGVGIVTAQAGPGLLVLDDLRGRRAPVPELTAATQAALAELLPPMTFQRNPVDTGRPGPELGRILAVTAADPGVDVLAGYALHEPDSVDLVAAVLQGRTPDVPVVFGVGGVGDDVVSARRALLGAGVAVATDPRGVAAATGALVADAKARARALPDQRPPALPIPVQDTYDEHEAKELIATLGIRSTPRRVCADRAAAHAALAELACPVAVKLLDAAVLHKTEIGGVALGVGTPADLDTALDALERAGATRFLVEAMAPAGVDLVVGARRDPVFGPIVLLGLGGTTAEALADVAVRLAPLSPVEAAALPDELACRALLYGWRGGPTVDHEELGRVVTALGDALAATPRLAEIEVNPLRLTAGGLLALDAVVVTREVAGAHPDR